MNGLTESGRADNELTNIFVGARRGRSGGASRSSPGSVRDVSIIVEIFVVIRAVDVLVVNAMVGDARRYPRMSTVVEWKRRRRRNVHRIVGLSDRHPLPERNKFG